MDKFVATLVFNLFVVVIVVVVCDIAFWDSYPPEAEWPGDGLETLLPAGSLAPLLNEYARPYTLAEGRKADGNTKVRINKKTHACLVTIVTLTLLAPRGGYFHD